MFSIESFPDDHSPCSDFDRALALIPTPHTVYVGPGAWIVPVSPGYYCVVMADDGSEIPEWTEFHLPREVNWEVQSQSVGDALLLQYICLGSLAFGRVD